MPNARIRPIADAWANILPSDLATLETNLAAGINGVDGSTHAPVAPIVLAGVDGLKLSGPAVIARGGRMTTTSDPSAATSPTITCSDNDWPVIDISNSYSARKLVVPLTNARGEVPFTWTVRRETAALQAYSPMFQFGTTDAMRASRAYVPMRAHDGATLTSLSVSFRVGAPHTALPTLMPSVRVLQIDTNGNPAVMTSLAAGADVNGYVYMPKPSSAAAWTNNLLTQTLVVPCDQNNAIDVGRYGYVVELVDEQGLTGYPWALNYVGGNQVLTSSLGTNTTLSGPALGAGTGDIVLVKDQSDPNTNGLYTVASGVWSRAWPLSAATQFTQGLVVPLVSFTDPWNSYSMWQVAPSISTWTPDKTPLLFQTTTDTASPAEGSSFFGHGLLWQSAIASYTNIRDLRPQ